MGTCQTVFHLLPVETSQCVLQRHRPPCNSVTVRFYGNTSSTVLQHLTKKKIKGIRTQRSSTNPQSGFFHLGLNGVSSLFDVEIASKSLYSKSYMDFLC